MKIGVSAAIAFTTVCLPSFSHAEQRVFFAGVATMPCNVMASSEEAKKYAVTWVQGYIGGVDMEIAKLNLDTSDGTFSKSKTPEQNYKDLEMLLVADCMVMKNSDVGDVAPLVWQGLRNLNH